MSSFDPYYIWLSIPPERQPPSHYQLLGLRDLEANPDVIDNAAELRLKHLQTHLNGEHKQFAEELIDEVGEVRRVLLDPVKKRSYDQSFARQVQSKVPAASQSPPAALTPSNAEDRPALAESIEVAAAGVGRRKSPIGAPLFVAGAAVAVAALIGISGYLMSQSGADSERDGRQASVENEEGGA